MCAKESLRGWGDISYRKIKISASVVLDQKARRLKTAQPVLTVVQKPWAFSLIPRFLVQPGAVETVKDMSEYQRPYDSWVYGENEDGREVAPCEHKAVTYGATVLTHSLAGVKRQLAPASPGRHVTVLSALGGETNPGAMGGMSDGEGLLMQIQFKPNGKMRRQWGGAAAPVENIGFRRKRSVVRTLMILPPTGWVDIRRV
ncbi:hypothetical protein EGW08_010887 [Elysia chlorotica]|uniref:Uncharacterized protein n=1 Tax=Elysia chlorotica TaxID=188477 RepID=A0A3S0ZKZ7_ELYCH|nr:hypothetical protein EGW08_010887 [Elysia chlorotica]